MMMSSALALLFLVGVASAAILPGYLSEQEAMFLEEQMRQMSPPPTPPIPGMDMELEEFRQDRTMPPMPEMDMELEESRQDMTISPITEMDWMLEESRQNTIPPEIEM